MPPKRKKPAKKNNWPGALLTPDYPSAHVQIILHRFLYEKRVLTACLLFTHILTVINIKRQNFLMINKKMLKCGGIHLITKPVVIHVTPENALVDEKPSIKAVMAFSPSSVVAIGSCPCSEDGEHAPLSSWSYQGMLPSTPIASYSPSCKKRLKRKQHQHPHRKK